MLDGVIKYNVDFQPTEPLASLLWERIERVRERLFALGLIGVSDEGIGYGNISERIGAKSFIITGTQTGHLEHLSAPHYARIETYDDTAFSLTSTGVIKPSSEALTHGTIYDLSMEIGAVIHVHSLSLWNFMLANRYKKTENVPYGSIAMIHEVNRIYAKESPLQNPKFVMSGHEEGIITFGRDLKEAELALYSVVADMI
jgi:ribulose-5-phosphate 4-epimerase/fuculose-1-phosphate aldolase